MKDELYEAHNRAVRALSSAERVVIAILFLPSHAHSRLFLFFPPSLFFFSSLARSARLPFLGLRSQSDGEKTGGRGEEFRANAIFSFGDALRAYRRRLDDCSCDSLAKSLVVKVSSLCLFLRVYGELGTVLRIQEKQRRMASYRAVSVYPRFSFPVFLFSR